MEYREDSQSEAINGGSNAEGRSDYVAVDVAGGNIKNDKRRKSGERHAHFSKNDKHGKGRYYQMPQQVYNK